MRTSLLSFASPYASEGDSAIPIVSPLDSGFRRNDGYRFRFARSWAHIHSSWGGTGSPITYRKK